jgi:glycosyltransferase involved in cell wall biosynthesis
MGGRAETRRILYVSGYADLTGGGQISLMLLLRHLDRSRFTPMLLCPHEGEVSRRARDLGIEVHGLGVRGCLDSLSAVGRVGALRRRAAGLRPHVVHCDTVYTALMTGLAFAGSRTPVIFHARTAESHRALDGLIPWLCSRIVCVSRAATRRFSTGSSAKISVIYNGVDLAEFRPGATGTELRRRLEIPPHAFVAGYCGQVIREKGLQGLVRAFALLRGEFPEATLLIAGNGRDSALVAGMASDGIHLLSRLEAMPGFFAALDVFVLPTLLHEGLSRALVEAMASGVPAIATPLGGNVETLVDGQTGYFVPPRDDRALHNRLRDLHLDAARRRRMGAAARERAERLFDAVACARAVEAVYRQVAP